MCDMCGDSDEYTSPPGTEARRREFIGKMEQKILAHGHQVMFIFPTAESTGAQFWYSVGRAMIGKPDLLVTGLLPQEVGQHIINEACRMIDEEGIVLGEGYEFAPDTLISNYPMRVVEADPVESEMTMARMVGGDITAYQLLWPDNEGKYPDEQGYDEKFTQPIYAKAN